MRNLNNTVDQIDHTAVYSTFHPIASQYIFFLIPHEKFSGIYYTLGHKTRLNKFNMQIMPNVFFSEHKFIKLEINNRRKAGHITNT